MRSDVQLSDPWASFLDDLDRQLTQPTELHCLGGFVVSELYEFMRPTGDIDILEVTKGTDAATLARIAGRLAEKPGLDVQVLQERYATELRPWLGRPEREGLTLQLWIEIVKEVQSRNYSDSTGRIRKERDGR